MTSESLLKIAPPALPVAFTIFGVWIYWHENPLPLLPPPIAFFGVVTLFYLFTHFDAPSRREPLLLMVCAGGLWILASITSHNLGRFLRSKEYDGVESILMDTDFWYAYVCAAGCMYVSLRQFFRLEPIIEAKVQADRK
jgi:hypothetical protein